MNIHEHLDDRDDGDCDHNDDDYACHRRDDLCARTTVVRCFAFVLRNILGYIVRINTEWLSARVSCLRAVLHVHNCSNAGEREIYPGIPCR